VRDVYRSTSVVPFVAFAALVASWCAGYRAGLAEGSLGHLAKACEARELRTIKARREARAQLDGIGEALADVGLHVALTATDVDRRLGAIEAGCWWLPERDRDLGRRPARSLPVAVSGAQ